MSEAAPIVPGAMTNLLAISEVSVAIGEARLLDDVSLSVAPGQWVGLIGPNGAGKSTLLRAVMNLVTFTGSVTLDGRPVSAMSARERGRTIALVPQAPIIPEGISVIDYVYLGRTPHLGLLARTGRGDDVVVNDVIDRLDLGGLANRLLATLSGGERQRVFIARALAQQPQVLLLDEPTTALDIGHQQDVLELLDRIRRDTGLSVLATMHDLTMAGSYSEHIVLLHKGRTMRSGTADEVLDTAMLRKVYSAQVEVLHPGPGHGPVVVGVRG